MIVIIFSDNRFCAINVTTKTQTVPHFNACYVYYYYYYYYYLLLKEVRFFQGKFVNSKKPRKVEDISKAFSKLVLQGKLTAAMKLLDNESSSGLLDLSPDVLQGLQDKHPQAADIAEESLLHGPIDYIPPNVYDLIDQESIYNSASKTKG